MEIKRDFYLNKLIQHKKNGMVKIITGVRRCGKSYLLSKLFKEHLLSCGVAEDHIVFLALDDYGNKKLQNPDELYAYVKGRVADSNDYYILLDEIQLVDDFESVINGFMHIANADIYITGSNSKFLSSDIITEFRGRGDEIRVYPLNFSEFYSVYGGEFDKAWTMYCNYGGMPLCLSMETPEDKAKYLTSLFDTTYLADIINRHNLRGNAEIGELTDVLASGIGSLTNPKKLADTFTSKGMKISEPTVNSYLTYLQDSFLISKAQRYDVKGKKYIDSPFKYYFTDTGLRNSRLNFRQQEENHIMENIIYNELKIRGFNVDVGIVNVRTRKDGKNTLKQHEVDFVCNKGSQRYYIQSAFAIPDDEKMQQEQYSLTHIDDSFKKIIVIKDNIIPWHTEKGILVIGILDFLLDNNSLEK